MNCTDAYIQETPGGAYYLMVRYPRQAKAHPLKQWCETEGKPKVKRYGSRDQAKDALIDWFRDQLNGRMTGTADGIQKNVRAEAERMFRRQTNG